MEYSNPGKRFESPSTVISWGFLASPGYLLGVRTLHSVQQLNDVPVNSGAAISGGDRKDLLKGGQRKCVKSSIHLVYLSNQ